MTIEETISGYFSEKEALSLFSDTTIFNRKYELKRFLNFCKANRVESPSEIKKKTIIAYLTHIKASKHSTKNVLYCLSSYLDFLVEKNIVEENIARFIDRPKFKHPEADYLEFNEVQTLFKCVAEKTTGKSVDRNILLLNLFFTLCLRASEAVNLRLNDVKLDSRILWVKQKGSNVVKLPINDDITDQFINWYEVRKEYNGSNTDFVFISSHGNKLTTRQAGNIVSNSMKLAGIKKNKNGPHILRHSGATFRLKRGENIRIIQKLLGHGSLSTTEKYLHFNETDLRDMIERSPIVISDLKV